jgi:hypothetical protein
MAAENYTPSSAPVEHGKPGPQTGPIVTVTIDNTPKDVHRGSHLVSELKTLLGVDASLVLDQVVDGKFTSLDDNARITITGGEVFVSHVRQGGSS